MTTFMMIYTRDGLLQYMPLVRTDNMEVALENAEKAVNTWNEKLRWIGFYAFVAVIQVQKGREVAECEKYLEKLRAK